MGRSTLQHQTNVVLVVAPLNRENEKEVLVFNSQDILSRGWLFSVQ